MEKRHICENTHWDSVIAHAHNNPHTSTQAQAHKQLYEYRITQAHKQLMNIYNIVTYPIIYIPK